MADLNKVYQQVDLDKNIHTDHINEVNKPLKNQYLSGNPFIYDFQADDKQIQEQFEVLPPGTSLTSKQKNDLIKSVANLSQDEYIEIFKIIHNHKVDFTENSNGIWIKFKYMNDTVLNEIYNFVNFCIQNQKRLYEKERDLEKQNEIINNKFVPPSNLLNDEKNPLIHKTIDDKKIKNLTDLFNIKYKDDKNEDKKIETENNIIDSMEMRDTIVNNDEIIETDIDGYVVDTENIPEEEVEEDYEDGVKSIKQIHTQIGKKITTRQSKRI